MNRTTNTTTQGAKATTEAQHKARIYERRRAELEARIEETITLLDAIDGDGNLEEGGDSEPSIGSLGKFINGRLEHDLDWDMADQAPLLGWANSGSRGRLEPVTLPFGWGHTDPQEDVSSWAPLRDTSAHLAGI